MEVGLVSDGALAQDINQALLFWRLREGLAEALQKSGAVYKYDLSIPVEKMYDLVEEMRTRLDEVHGWHPSLALAPEVEEESLELSMIDAASGGALVDKTPAAARSLISNMEANSQQFGVRQEVSVKGLNETNSNVEQQLAQLTSMV
ncbi:uncharacterized protein LOC133799962 [Humulus lupulus]|uniref:uncharacterized protein LOC133799962 n=1 Tax=Humulus lupulus TaxID=3486 RepID=UPI002B406CCC|nr:uncharacterized protein LOC133799962 [Humulus lupulus]